MARIINEWYRWNALVPSDIDAATPRRVLKLGDHIGRTVTLDKDYWLVICYRQDGDPEKYMVIFNPHRSGA